MPAASRTAAILVVLGTCAAELSAQAPAARPARPANAKAAAPVDLTGQWLSLITEDWNYRMMVAQKGDFLGVPINPEGRKIADAWDPAKDEAAGEQCKAYGAPAIMRAPGRIRISWSDDDTLKLETDAGMQTRMFYFKDIRTKGGDWQGISRANWEMVGVGGLAGTSPAGGGVVPEAGFRPSGSLKVVTTNMKAGYLRKNGIPYSDKAVLTEYYDRMDEPNGETLLVVTSVVEDPTYLVTQFVTSAHFKLEKDSSGWKPTPCTSR